MTMPSIRSRPAIASSSSLSAHFTISTSWPPTVCGDVVGDGADDNEALMACSADWPMTLIRSGNSLCSAAF